MLFTPLSIRSFYGWVVSGFVDGIDYCCWEKGKEEVRRDGAVVADGLASIIACCDDDYWLTSRGNYSAVGEGTKAFFLSASSLFSARTS